MCVDHRAVNKVTNRIHYPLPLMDDQLDLLRDKEYFIIFFFFSLSPFTLLGLSGTFYGRLVFVIFPVVRRGSGVLSPATHAHPLSSPFSGRHNTNTTTHNIHGRPIRPGIRTLLTSRWCRKSVALPSTTLPSAPDRHTHTSMARRRFLPSKKSSPFGGIRTH
jgi:hypothetical protein